MPDQAVNGLQGCRNRIRHLRPPRPLLRDSPQRRLQRATRVRVGPSRTARPKHADHVAASIKHRPAAIAAANRARRLNIVIPDLDHLPAARDCQRLAAGIPHDEDLLTDILLRRRSEPHRRDVGDQLRIRHFEQRQIELRIVTQHDRTDGPLAVDQRDKRRPVLNHVMRRHESPVADMKRRSQRPRSLNLPGPGQDALIVD